MLYPNNTPAIANLQLDGIDIVSSINTKLSSPLSVVGPLTDEQLRALAVSVSVSNFPLIQAVSGPLTNIELRASPIPVSGSVSVSNFPAVQATAETRVGASTATPSAVTLSTANVAQLILPANPNRKFAYIINNSGATVYIGFGYTPTSVTGLPLASGTTLAINYNNLFLGALSAVAASNNRSLQMIEG